MMRGRERKLYQRSKEWSRTCVNRASLPVLLKTYSWRESASIYQTHNVPVVCCVCRIIMLTVHFFCSPYSIDKCICLFVHLISAVLIFNVTVSWCHGHRTCKITPTYTYRATNLEHLHLVLCNEKCVYFCVRRKINRLNWKKEKKRTNWRKCNF